MTLIGKGPQSGGGTGSGSGTVTPTITVFEDESITVTNVYTTLVTVDLDDVSDAVVVLSNDSGTETLDYKIFASAKIVGSAPAAAHDSWVNVLDTNSDPADYDDTTSKTLLANQTFYESLSNKFRWFRLDMKAQTTTVTAKVWFRGRSVA